MFPTDASPAERGDPGVRLETFVDEDGMWCAQLLAAAVALRDGVLFGVYRAPLTEAEYAALNDAAIARVKAGPHRKVWMVVALTPGVGIPTPGLLALSRGVMQRLGPHLRADALVVLGSGALRSAMRSAMAALALAVDPGWPHAVFGTVADGVAWVEARARAAGDSVSFDWVPLMARAFGATAELAPPDVETAADPLIGTALAARYVLTRRAGSGGMGVVYDARDAFTGRRVAVKVLRRTGNGYGAVEVNDFARFEREVLAASRVVHPNVARVLGMGHDPERGVVFYVQQFLDGVTLRTRLDGRGALSVGEGWSLLEPVMQALVAAHGAGVVHRDVKPENVILARGAVGETPYLVDFGAARLTGAAAATRVTGTGAVVGTAAYMAPEQARGERDLDDRVDVWAMGVIWYEALAGRSMFGGASYNEVIARVLTERPTPLAEVVPGLAPALCAAIEGALAAAPADRHRDMATFLGAIRAAIGEAPSP